MSTYESHSVLLSNSDSIATPTAQEQLNLDAMFKDLFYNCSRESGLVMVVKLMHCVANGTAVEWLRQCMTQRVIYNNLACFDLSISSVDAKRIDDVKFNTSATAPWGGSCLSEWAMQSDSHATNYVTESFQLLKRSGGVTLQTALLAGNCVRNAYHCALLSHRMDWVMCLLSEPALNQGWNLPSEQEPTPLFNALSRDQSLSSAVCEEMSLSIEPIMDDEAVNMSDKYGYTLLLFAVRRPIVSLLKNLLSRPELNMNPIRTVRSGMRSLLIAHQTSVIAAFDTVARRFSIVPLWIHEAVHNDCQITLPIPLCTIIYHYYRMPYPICECNPVIAAAAPNKHSPFYFCFPTQ